MMSPGDGVPGIDHDMVSIHFGEKPIDHGRLAMVSRNNGTAQHKIFIDHGRSAMAGRNNATDRGNIDTDHHVVSTDHS